MSTLTQPEIVELSRTLRKARLDCIPIAPLLVKWPRLTTKDAWRVQLECLELEITNGDHLIGYKLGNIAKAMQSAFGIDQPDYGHVLNSTLVFEGTAINLDRLIEPFIELEPAFVLKAPLKGPGVTIVDVINATDYVLPSLEIIDSRIKNWKIDLIDTLADNGSTGNVILGATPRCLTDLTLQDTRGWLCFNGKEVSAGNTKSILGNPVAAIAWLCNRLAEYDVEFQAGQVILPGSCLEAMPMRQKGHWSGTFEGFGTVELDIE